ncbi:Na+/H+ antiporter NhaA [Subtercola sp. RTI3]|uniref:Na+/H+ antiporter NhaA n=1 Tax=Subtercola sp. RTI3 TaxID=3048639 RepID=UPI002B22A5F5|nr:Na+/H+ antiporter NhaA [Subtercola sp. RTI3]MEA9987003.1 Na+/H+ antiporter NhaA [Subtercola sp. RTI3]
MSILRSERNSAAILLVAAALGLVLANSPAGSALFAAKNAHVGFAGIGLDLSLGHWISDGLLAIFFFIVAVELKHELVAGSLNSPAKAIVPAIAALGGVIVPAGVFLIATIGSPYGDGWPIPTATDIAFALGVLAIFGRALPTRVRIFLLALAVLDDLVAILIIAVFFTTSLNLPALGGAAVAIVVFALLSRALARRRTTERGGQWMIVAAMIVVAIAAWYFMYQSGVHATIAGVALGLAMAGPPAARAAHALQPISNGLVLPLFAFAAALVAIPSVGIGQLTPAFWGILIALPVGKVVGITVAGVIANRTVGRNSPALLSLADLVMIGGLGGIGFTVSLLMNELAFAGLDEVVDEGTLAVLLGSAVSIVVAAVLVSRRSRAYGAADADAAAAGAASASTLPAGGGADRGGSNGTSGGMDGEATKGDASDGAASGASRAGNVNE